MIEKITGLEIEGRKFTTKQRIVLFDPTEPGAQPQRLALVYGRNGSGKTTIASAFRQTDPAFVDKRLSVSLVADDGSRITLPDEAKIAKAAIRVFDERYVDEKIKLLPDESGLGSIVLFSDPGDFEKDIKKLEGEKSTITEVCSKLKLEIEELEDAAKPSSPAYLWESVKSILKAGWAEEDRILKGTATKSRVSDSLAEEIAKLKCETANKDIVAEANKIRASLESLSSAGEVSNIPALSEFALGTFDEQAVLELLNQKIEKPVLTDREKNILAILGKYAGRVEEIRETFSSEIEYCPYCFRSIGADEKASLKESIEKVLNREVENYKAKLISVALPTFSFDKSSYTAADSALSEQIESKLAKARAIVESYRADILARAANVYGDTVYASRNLEAVVASANLLVEKLERKREDLVGFAQRKSSLKDTLFRLCKEKAHYQVESAYKAYQDQDKVLNDKRGSKKELELRIAELDAKINGLKAQKKGIKLAVDCINQSLRYIYASYDRFMVEAKDGKYVLKSHGFDIKPSDVSTGERHALALAYFFVDINANHQLNEFYLDEMMLVVDDPVSSFDAENKVGVFSFLMRQFGNVLTGNANSRVIMLTHDVYTMIQLSNASETLVKDILPGPKFKIRLLTMLPTGEFSNFNPEKHNEYSALLSDVYRFAKTGESSTCAFSVGNEIRRVLEAYSTFLYRKDSVSLFYDKSLRDKFGDLAEYFAAKMDRTVFHGESHLKYQAQAFSSDGNFFAIISDGDRQQVAKDALCILYLLDAEHLRAHLIPMTMGMPKTNAIGDVEMWIEDIRKTVRRKNEK